MSRTNASTQPGEAPDRPAGDYRREYVRQARILCQMGFTEEGLASFFDVDELTIRQWRVSHPEFDKAVEVGSYAADDAVERALFLSCVGYTRIERKRVRGKIIELERHVPSNVSGHNKMADDAVP